MSNCNDYPTPDDAKTFKSDAITENERVTLQQDRTNPASDGKTKKTMWGIENDFDTLLSDAENAFEDLGDVITDSAETLLNEIDVEASTQRDQFNDTFQSQFVYKHIGNISLYVGDSLPEVDKLNSYQFPDDSDRWYGPIQSQPFPITIPADPSIDDGWALVNALTSDSLPIYTDIVYKASGGNSAVENMIAGIPVAVPVGRVVETAGYYTDGDGGGAKYIIYPSGTSADGYVDHGLDNGTVAVFNNTSEISVLQAGAKGIGNSFDDTPHIQAALDCRVISPTRDEYASSLDVVVPPVDEYFYVTSDLIIRRTQHLKGTAPDGRGLGGSKIVFADTCNAGVFIQAPGGDSAPEPYKSELGAGQYSGYGSSVSNLVLEPENEGMVDYGLIHNVRATISGVHCSRFGLAGFFAHGGLSGGLDYGNPNSPTQSQSMWGNTNGSLYTSCFSRQNTNGHGFAAQGNNAQAMTYISCSADTNKGSGFLDNSSLGNHYIGCLTQGCTVKVLHNGSYWMSIFPHTADASNEPGVGVDYLDYWVELTTATIEDEVWALGSEYIYCGGYNIAKSQLNKPTLTGCYSEGGIELGAIVRGGALVSGGNISDNYIYMPPDDRDLPTVIGGNGATAPRWTAPSAVAGADHGASLGLGADSTVMYSCGNQDDPDVSTAYTNGVVLRYSSSRDAYEFTKGVSSSTTRMLSFTTSNYSFGDYSGKYLYAEQGILIGGRLPNKVSTARNEGDLSGQAVVRGQWIMYSQAAAGTPPGCQVTTTGIVGSTAVLKNMAPIDV